jgi:SAM-dependent methyltransferase
VSAPEPQKPSDSIAPATIDRLQAGVGPALAMLAGMQLEVFTLLAEGPLRAKQLAGKLGVREDRLSRLLYALVAAELLELRGDEFANAAEASAFLVTGRPRYLGGVHEVLDQLWRADLLTAQSIRSGGPAALHDFASTSDEEMAAMLRGLHASAIATGRELAERFDFSACRSVVDVGGGSGGLIAALCQASPSLSGVLFDLPRTVSLAAPILAGTPGGERVSIEAGDILAGAPQGQHDAAVLKAFVQVLSAENAERAIANVARALRAGGKLYIIGSGILDNGRLTPMKAVFFNVTFMNLYADGASYTEAQHAQWLSAAGCKMLGRSTLSTGSGLIWGEKLH